MNAVNELPLDYTAQVFKALGDESRLKILKLLSTDDKHYCVGAMAGILGISQPAVSQHLKILKQAGLISFTKTGNHKHFFLTEKSLDRWKIDLRALMNTIEMPAVQAPCCGI